MTVLSARGQPRPGGAIGVETLAPDRVVWVRRYRVRLRVSDAVVLGYALLGSHLVRFGTASPTVQGGARTEVMVTYAPFTVGLGIVWLLALVLGDTRDVKLLGAGGEEYRRIVSASAQLFAAVAIVAYLAKVDVARSYLAIAFPVGTCLLLFERWLWRRWLASQRAVGRWCHRVLVVGSAEDVGRLADELRRVPAAGLRVVGSCLSGVPQPGDGVPQPGDGVPQPAKGGVPVLGSMDDLLVTVAGAGVDTVAVAASGEVSPDVLRRIGWQLEGTGVALVVAPALTNIAGSRIHVQPVAGLALLHIEEPRLPRGGQIAKDVLDRVGALLLLLVLSPVLLATAVVVRSTSPGPAFYRQDRIGWRGRTFSVWKFRSMRVGADAQLAGLLAAAGTQDTPLFKVRDDPRLSPVGRVLRTYSLDELPQLFNVLVGDMSLVGPRPQRPAEVVLYDELAQRRLLAKPGMTGHWQVSGRSDLSWEEAVRLDLYYVENWTFTFDLVLLWRTVFTVVRGRGAV